MSFSTALLVSGAADCEAGPIGRMSIESMAMVE